ncbi:MAG: hypothetical protein O7F16_12350 [Acidobacteria bacterium]|nr:hypothetical protein [Acidobacteriota bacterium]
MLKSCSVKYRQRGYKDSDREERPGRPPGPREPRGPREVYTQEANTVWRCADCGHQMRVPDSVPSSETCLSCSRPLHNCRNCTHFDTSARFECKEPIQAPIRSKSQANNCDQFAPAVVLDATGRRASSAGPPNARAAFHALFGNKKK